MKTTIIIIIILTCRIGYSQNIDSLNITPNPFSTATYIYYGLANNDTVSLNIYNRWGQNVKTLMHDSLINSGNYSIYFQADSLAIGIYFVQLKLGTHKTINRKIVKTGGTTQSYFNFPSNNTVWTYLRCDYSYSNMPETTNKSCNTEYFTLSGDTVINSLTYHKIYSSTVPNKFNNLYAIIREDSLKKVYVNPIPSNTFEYLKFDFSRIIGDTMQTNPVKTITAIDSVLISSLYRKRFILSSHDTIIEGIGNINDAIGMYFYVDKVDFTLLCMTTNNNLIYQSPQYQTCDTSFSVTTVGINTTNALDKYFKIYPNPTVEHLYIDFTDWNKAASISLYDIAGQMLVNKQILFNGINTLQISPFAQGMYFYKIFSDNEMLKSGKIVIQK